MGAKYTILIGINGYHESLGRLKCCVSDMRRLADVLTQGNLRKRFVSMNDKLM